MKGCWSADQQNYKMELSFRIRRVALIHHDVQLPRENHKSQNSIVRYTGSIYDWPEGFGASSLALVGEENAGSCRLAS